MFDGSNLASDTTTTYGDEYIKATISISSLEGNKNVLH
jgi:hypothetical protein